MAIKVKTKNAKALLAKIDKFLSEGKAKTWGIGSAKGRFTHTPPQWDNEAYFTGSVDEHNTLLKFSFSRTGTAQKEWDALYPSYHGRFVSFLFDHFHDDFTSVLAVKYPRRKK